MTDLTKLTAKDLHDMLSTGLTSWTPPLYAVMREFVRRAEGYALACADRDSARDELAEMKALRDAAKSDHKEACRILRNYQTLAEERGREINALIRERDELHRRAQANAQVQAERDEFDEELHTCRAIVGATSEHLHVDLEELVDKLRRTEADSRSWQELATARAQANDRLRSAAQAVLSWLNGEALEQYPSLAAEATHDVEPLRCNLETALAAAPAAPPTPAAPVTDAEIEAAITALTVDARREADALRVNPEASGTATEKRANRQVQLRALIARRVASAGAAPVDGDIIPLREAFDHLRTAYDALRAEINECHVFLATRGIAPERPLLERIKQCMRPAPVDSERASADRYESHLFHTDDGRPSSRCRVCGVVYKEAGFVPCKPAPAGDQDAKLREAIEALEAVATKQQKVELRDAAHRILRGYSPCTNCGKWAHRSEGHWPCNPIAPVAAPAASATTESAKLRELRARLLSTAASLPNRQMGHSDEDFDRGYVEACENWAQEIDRLLAAPAASAIAAAPEAPSWTAKMIYATERMSDDAGYAHSECLNHVDINLMDVREFVFRLREQVESHARRIEALERANNKEAVK